MSWREKLRAGVVIPAHPLALTSERKLDERRQRALTRYYLAAGAGGVAVGVHTTQFAIRDPRVGLFEPVLKLAMEDLAPQDVVKVAGICGPAPQACREAEFAAQCGYDAGLLSLGFASRSPHAVDELIAHARAVADVIPVFGFYLQPAVGGVALPYEFWRKFAEIENVVAVKIAPFNRYQTLDVMRAIADSGRTDIALYTGNDDQIVFDLLTPPIVGGLLGHWSVWTRRAVELLDGIHSGISFSLSPLDRQRQAEAYATLALEVTDANAAFFDPSHDFRGCIAGLHEVLRRQGLLAGRWCLDPNEDLSPGQMEEIDRVYKTYPHLNDDAFVREHLDDWLG